MPNADLKPNEIEITISKIDASISVRLGDNMNPNDHKVQEDLRAILGDTVNVDDVIRGLQACPA
jgi:hypothetical protein